MSKLFLLSIFIFLLGLAGVFFNRNLVKIMFCANVSFSGLMMQIAFVSKVINSNNIFLFYTLVMIILLFINIFSILFCYIFWKRNNGISIDNVSSERGVL